MPIHCRWSQSSDLVILNLKRPKVTKFKRSEMWDLNHRSGTGLTHTLPAGLGTSVQQIKAELGTDKHPQIQPG